MQQYDPNIHHRRSIRLKEYDYSSAGLYFITICCDDRICRFGHVENGQMVLNNYGQIAYDEWTKLPKRFPNMELDAFQIMPNHMHAIITLIPVRVVGATLAVAQHNDDAVAQHNDDAVAQHNDDAVAQHNDDAVAQHHDDAVAQHHVAIAQHHHVAIAQHHDDAVAQHNDDAVAQHHVAIAQHHHVAIAQQNDDAVAQHHVAIAQHHHVAIAQHNDDAVAHHHDDAVAQHHHDAAVPHEQRATARVAPTVSDIVGAYKSLTANACLNIYKQKNATMGKFWQRNYYEHIIRDERAYQNIREYIINNPLKWAEDKFYIG